MKNVRNIGCPSPFFILRSSFSVLHSPFFILRSQFSVDALVNTRNLNLMLMGFTSTLPPLRRANSPCAMHLKTVLRRSLMVAARNEVRFRNLAGFTPLSALFLSTKAI